MQIHQSAEDYLETILILKERKGMVRSIDIANELQFTKASVSVAMKKLRENGYAEMDPEGFITLTKAGMEVASRIYDRHKPVSYTHLPAAPGRRRPATRPPRRWGRPSPY